MDLSNENLKKVWVLFPSYSKDMVNGTMMVFGDHREWIGIRVETLEIHLANEYCLDLPVLRRRTGIIVKNKRHMPIIFSRGCKFIQFHYRHPDATNDGAYGIVRTDVIRDIIQAEGYSIIILVNGKVIHSIDRAKTLYKYLDMVKIAVGLLPHLELSKNDCYDLIFDVVKEYGKNNKNEWR